MLKTFLSLVVSQKLLARPHLLCLPLWFSLTVFTRCFHSLFSLNKVFINLLFLQE